MKRVLTIVGESCGTKTVVSGGKLQKKGTRIEEFDRQVLITRANGCNGVDVL